MGICYGRSTADYELVEPKDPEELEKALALYGQLSELLTALGDVGDKLSSLQSWALEPEKKAQLLEEVQSAGDDVVKVAKTTLNFDLLSQGARTRIGEYKDWSSKNVLEAEDPEFESEFKERVRPLELDLLVEQGALVAKYPGFDELPSWVFPAIVGGAFVTYGSAPLQLFLATRATCAGGTPTTAYVMIAASAAYVSSLDLMLWKLAGSGPKVEGGFRLLRCRLRTYFDKVASVDLCKDGASKLLDLGFMIFTLGKLEVLDLFTDFLLPGQVSACETDDPAFVKIYQHSWHFLLQGQEKGLTLSGVMYGCLCFAYVIQVVQLCRIFRRSGAKGENAGGVLEACGMTLSAKIFLGAQAEKEGADEDDEISGVINEAEVEGSAVFMGVLTRCAFEACPSAWNAIVFMAMSYDEAGPGTKVKTCASVLLSFATILGKVPKLIFKNPGSESYNSHPYKKRGLAMAFFLFFFVLAVLTKFVMIFFCDETHLYNLSQWQCVSDSVSGHSA